MVCLWLARYVQYLKGLCYLCMKFSGCLQNFGYRDITDSPRDKNGDHFQNGRQKLLSLTSWLTIAWQVQEGCLAYHLTAFLGTKLKALLVPLSVILIQKRVVSDSEGGGALGLTITWWKVTATAITSH